MTVIPRPPVKKIKGISRVKSPWDISKSIFKDYIWDNDEIYLKCFEYDWKNSKIPKFVKNPDELSRVKEYLREVYKHL